MVFSSLIFVYIFLPVVIILYFLAKEEYRNYILLVWSIIFYTYGEPKFVFIMLCSIVLNYAFAIAIDKKQKQEMISGAKAILVLCIVINVGILFVYKYLDFAIDILNMTFRANIQHRNIALPIGISFFTFQALSYVVDVYRGTVKVQRNPLYVALYISFFPQLIAGPIVRYSTIEEQIARRKCDLEGFSQGGKRFMLGFCKKVLLANNLSVVVTEVFSMDARQANPLILWLGSICFSLQILYDFSGYSDMAIGLGRIFGFKFLENFDYPYISQSVTEFWRRWHISLGQWFRDYIYIPLGGSRVSTSRHIFNLFVVWILTGIWHGANYTFIVWGMGYYVLLIIEKYFVKPDKRKTVIQTIWRVVTLLVVNFGWVIFNSTGLRKGICYCLAMIGWYGIAPTVDGRIIRYFREYGFFIIIGILFSTPIMKHPYISKIYETKAGMIAEILIAIVYGVIFLWAVSFIILGAHNPFIYFNF